MTVDTEVMEEEYKKFYDSHIEKPVIINVHGKAEHGKDTFANKLMNWLYEEYNYKVQKLKFGDKVKEKAIEYGWNGKKDRNGRAFIQYVGQREREDDPLHWIKKVKPEMDNTADFIIFADTRHVNEITYWEVNSYITRTVKVVRLDEDGNKHQGLEGKLAQHKSETNLDDFKFDYTYQAECEEELKNYATTFATELIGWEE